MQPEAMFQAGVEHLTCPECQIKNYIYLTTCRACRARLSASAPQFRPFEVLEQGRERLGEICYRAKQGSTIGVLIFIVMGFLTGRIQHHAHGDGMSTLIIMVMVGFAGGLVGWIVAFAGWSAYFLCKPWRGRGASGR